MFLLLILLIFVPVWMLCWLALSSIVCEEVGLLGWVSYGQRVLLGVLCVWGSNGGGSALDGNRLLHVTYMGCRQQQGASVSKPSGSLPKEYSVNSGQERDDKDSWMKCNLACYKLA